MPITHIGDDEIIRLTDACWPTIQQREDPRYQMATFGQLCATFGAAMQERASSPDRIAYALNHAGSIYAGWYGVENPSPAPEVPQPPAPSVQGSLRVEDNRRWFANDAGRFDWREVTAFGLIGQVLRGDVAEATAFVVDMTRRRFNVFRVLTTLMGDYWDTRRCGPNFAGHWEAMDRTIDLVAAHGGYVRLCIFGGLDNFGGSWDPAARRDEFSGDIRRRGEEYALQVAERYRDHPAVFLELTNEPDQIGFRDSRDKLMDLGRRVKAVAPGRLLNIGGHCWHGDTWACKPPADANDTHQERVYFDTPEGRNFIPTAKRSGEDPNIDVEHQPAKMPYISGEPPNLGEPPPGRIDFDPSPVTAFTLAAVARARQYNLCYHWDRGLFCELPTPTDSACMDAHHRALDAFPMLTGVRWRGHWAESFIDRSFYPAHDDERTVLDHVHAGRGPWRVFGVDGYAATILEPASLDMSRHALAPLRVVDRIVHGRYAAGVYARA